VSDKIENVVRIEYRLIDLPNGEQIPVKIHIVKRITSNEVTTPANKKEPPPAERPTGATCERGNI
jgi:hypothetical protein